MSELDIPESWAKCRVGDALTLQNGFAFKSDDFLSSGTKVVRISNIQNNAVDLSDAVFVKPQKEYEKFEIESGDLLVAMSGATTGKMGVFAAREKAYQNQRVGNIKVRKLTTVEDGFRNYYFQYIQPEILKEAYGGAQPNISGKMIEDFQFPIPPLGEQRRIVTKIESTFKRIEAIEKTVENAEKIATKMALSFLKDSARDADSQSTIADSYSERIERCKEAGQGLRKVGVSNEHGVVDLRITDEVDTAKYKLVYKGDIFYNPMRLNVGSLALYDGNRPAITSPDYIVVRPKGTECSWLLYCFLKSEIGQQEIAKKTKGSVRERVYFKSLSEIAFPELSQNLNRAAHLSFEAVKKMTGNVTTAIQQLKPLRSSILTQAFSGRLVPQDPSEGTGHQLLEQILAAKTESDTAKAKSKDAAAKPKPRKTKK